jgi:hypothetical protein
MVNDETTIGKANKLHGTLSMLSAVTTPLGLCPEPEPVSVSVRVTALGCSRSNE